MLRIDVAYREIELPFRLTGLLLLMSMSHATAQMPSTAVATPDTRYREPPAPLMAVVDQPRAPSVSISPRRTLMLLTGQPALPPIDVVAAPEARLAGLRINPKIYAQSRFLFGVDLALLDIASGTQRKIAGLPDPARIADVSWSTNERFIALTRWGDAGVELWLIDVAAARARRLIDLPLHAVTGRGFAWLGDNQLIVTLRPANLGPAPAAPVTPPGPNVQETAADAQRGVQAIRTFPDLLKTSHDEALFEHFLTAQLARVDLQGNVRPIGAPRLLRDVSVSPDARWLLVSTVKRPFSYVVPYQSFARQTEVLDLDGKPVHVVADLPLVEGGPPSFDAVNEGRRGMSWRNDAPATLVWVEALDGGDPAKPAAADGARDAMFMQAHPFDMPPRALARLSRRLESVQWGDGNTALITEAWYKDRQAVTWRVAPDVAFGAQATAPVKLFERNFQDRYADPGTPVMRPNRFGRAVMLLTEGGRQLWLDGDGASVEGDRPFLDAYDLTTRTAKRVWQSAAPHYENVVALLDDGAARVITRRESQTEPVNFYIRDLRAAPEKQLTALTRFTHPLPALKDVKKELIRYKRGDGVDLTANLYLPPGYDRTRDGPLPFILWAYPQEFKSAATAGQTRGSPYEFNTINYWGPQAFLAMGYGVLDDPAMPIIGEGGKESNDTYVQQLVASAQAAVDEIVRRGVADKNRIAVGGHSYGAFMTANLLAHTRLFKAGIARSGAYNRTLTPFGFQGEERPFWKAREAYNTMSPFNFADGIKDPLLLIHGEADANSGTFPIQSERLFQAVKGLGGTARLVMLPAENHGYRARESILHMLWETNAWLERHVKNGTVAE
jgi:dipeptidyl aminopeptidase/acylaminoacyl peptidase